MHYGCIKQEWTGRHAEGNVNKPEDKHFWVFLLIVTVPQKSQCITVLLHYNHQKCFFSVSSEGYLVDSDKVSPAIASAAFNTR